MKNRCSLSGNRIPQIRMAGDFTVKAGWTLGWRRLEEYELVYFPAGTATRYQVEGNEYVLAEPCFVLTRPFEAHSYHFDAAQPTRHLFIHFTYESNEEKEAACPVFHLRASPLVMIRQTSFLPGLLKHILQLVSLKPNRWEERSNLLLYTFLTELNASADASGTAAVDSTLPPQIAKALQYIDNRLHLPLTVAEIARHTGWTHEHFTRMFVQATGVSPQSSIVHRRIEKACRLLIQTEASIKQISYEVGFQDEHYFSRCFSKIKGVPASEYRKQFSDPRALHLAPPDEYSAGYPLNRYFIVSDQ